MTILPKKKQNKEKNENDNNEGPQSPPGAEGGSGRGVLARVRQSSPQRWASPPPIDHESSGRFEDCPSSHGAVGNNKRRIRDRSSPHRTVRKQRHEVGPRTSATVQSQVAQAASGGASTRGSTSRQQLASCPGADTRLAASTSLTSQVNSEDERNDRFNSDDERERPYDASLAEKEKDFEMMLKEKRGFVIKRMAEDGACLFRAVADQVYGDQEMHSIVRLNCVDYMSKNMEFFKQFVTEDFNEYLNRKKRDDCHGNHIEMQALCELYNRPIEVYQLSICPINTFNSSYQTDNDPIRVSYHNNVHYNSVVDPYKATVGVGLGLPGYQPGLADRNLVRDAVRQSEDCQIEQTMLEDKLRETDWEVTQETIEEQVARESYLQWLKDQERIGKSKASPRSATCSSATENQQHHLWWDLPSTQENPKTPRNKSDQSSPKQLEGGQSPKSPLYQCTSSTAPPGASLSKSCIEVGGAKGGEFNETTSLMNELPPHLFGLSDWDDDTGMLAQAIAESQQQYLNELKMAARSGSPEETHSSSTLEGKGKSLMPKDGYNRPS